MGLPVDGEGILLPTVKLSKEEVLIDDIYNLNMKILDLHVSIEDMKEKEKLMKYSMMNLITAEVKENGKPKFSNAESRQAELVVGLAVNEDFINLKKQLRKEEYERAILQFKLERKKNLLNLYIASGKAGGHKK